MMKIGLYITCGPQWGGTFQYSLGMLQELRELENKGLLKLVVLYEDESWKDLLESHGALQSSKATVPIFYRAFFLLWQKLPLPISWWQFFCNHFHPVIRMMNQENCDLWFFPSQDPLSYFGKFRAATSIHDLMHRYESRFPEVGNPAEFRSREFHFKNITRYSHTILVDSELGKQHVMDSYGKQLESKILILPYIIPSYLESKTADFRIIEKFSIPQRYFFYPAQFWKHKNHEKLLKAFAEVKAKYPEVGLVLSGGKKNGYESAVALAQELKLGSSVIFPGYVSENEIIALYKRTVALVMPTFFGPTNIPPLEALSLGAKVVYSRIYAYKEFLGDEAVFVDPEDPADIAKGMLITLQSTGKPVQHDSLARKLKFRAALERLISGLQQTRKS